MAIDDSTSIDWAREIRGTASIASAVTPAAPSRSTSSGLRAGAIRLMTVAPGRSRPISSSVGALTLTSTSLDHTSSAGTTRTPASVKATSGWSAAAPAPCSTTTSYPSAASWEAVFAVAATSVSPGLDSRGMPMRTAASWEDARCLGLTCGGVAGHNVPNR